MNWEKTKILILAGGIAIFISCGRIGTKDDYFVWPPHPEKPKIVYIDSIYGSYNLPRSFFGKLKDFLFGKSPDLDIVKPYGVIFDGLSKLYVVDTSKKGILVFNMKSGNTDFFYSLGNYGVLGEPIGIALDSKNNIYVSDTKLGKVAVFNEDFVFSHFIGENGELENPVGLAIGTDDNRIYIVDAKLNKVKIFGLKGNFLGEFGGRGDNQGEFYFPLGIAVSKADIIYVVDSFHFAVQAFDLDGNYLFSFGPGQGGAGCFARPRDIAVDSENNLFVTDALNHNVQIFDSRGRFLMEFGSLGIDPGQFRLPAGIYIADNDLYVSDSINGRIQKFEYIHEN